MPGLISKYQLMTDFSKKVYYSHINFGQGGTLETNFRNNLYLKNISWFISTETYYLILFSLEFCRLDWTSIAHFIEEKIEVILLKIVQLVSGRSELQTRSSRAQILFPPTIPD